MSEILASPEQISGLITAAVGHNMLNCEESPYPQLTSLHFWYGQEPLTLPDAVRDRAGLTPEQATDYKPATILNTGGYLDPRATILQIDLRTTRPDDELIPQDWIQYQIKGGTIQPTIAKYFIAESPALKRLDSEIAKAERHQRIREIFEETGGATDGEPSSEFMQRSMEYVVESTLIRGFNLGAARINAKRFADENDLAGAYADEVEALHESIESWR